MFRFGKIECDEETWSWWHFTPDQVDPYWIRCTLIGPHTAHEDSNTGVRWFYNENSTLLQWERHRSTMIFMTYRPKTAKNVKAEKITAENINDIAASFFGSARVIKHAEQGPTLKIATLEGIITGELTNWVVRHEDAVEVMSDEDFEKKYERARNLRES